MKKSWINKVPPKKWMMCIVIISIVTKVLAMIALQSWKFESDFHFAYESGEIGAALAMGKGYSWLEEREHHHSKPNEPTAWEVPVYPLIIAAVFKGFGIYSTSSAVVLIVFQIIISAMICWVLFSIGRYIFNDWAGVWAALVFAFNPSAMHFVVQKIYTTPLYVLLLLLFVYQLLKIADVLSYKRSILTGLICGLAILTVPVIIAFVPFALGWLLYRGKGERKSRWISVCLIVVAMCATLSPWEIRNYVIFDRFIPVRSNLGRELLLGSYGHEILDEITKKQLNTADEGKRTAIYEKTFSKALRDAPEIFFLRVYERGTTFWTAMPRMDGPYAPKKGDMRELVLGGYYLFTLVFGLAGLSITRLKNIGVQLLALALVSLPIPFYLTWFSRFRYRFPVEMILTILVGHSICFFWGLCRGRWRRSGSEA